MSKDEKKKHAYLHGLITILAILVIALLECVALSHGINGTALTLSIAAIAGLGGFSFDKMRKLFAVLRE